MEGMTKETLREYRDILEEIAEHEEMLAELDARAMKCTTRMSDEPHVQSQIHDSMAEVVAQKVDASVHINTLVAQSYQVLGDIETAINQLPSRSRRVIRHRYIDGMSWEKICVTMGYEWAQIHRIHADALKQLET